jgi:hypothetical protein
LNKYELIKKDNFLKRIAKSTLVTENLKKIVLVRIKASLVKKRVDATVKELRLKRDQELYKVQ